jgi:NAD-dependent deacetylase
MSGNEDRRSKIERAAQILARGKRCVALTGSGLSVPSGIPDFRSKGGLWDKFDPETYATSHAWRQNPGRVWDLFREVGKLLLRSEPNPAHTALGRLEELGVVQAVITQNIDGLHQAGGSKNVIEFHGNGRDVYCTACGRRMSEEEEIRMMQSYGLPKCPDCGGNLRPDVVLFGEPVPMEAMVKALAVSSNCRSMMVIGTSGIVAPASSLPFEAKNAGASIVELNISSTTLTSIADVSVFESAADSLPEILDAVEARMQRQ